MTKKSMKTVFGGLVGFALCASSTVAIAATSRSAAVPNPASISPFVALSAFGTMQSRSAVCATAVGAAGAAAAAGQATSGCVLPVLDPVAPAVFEAAPVAPVAYAPVAAEGYSLFPLLAGLALVAGLAAFLLFDNDGRDEGGRQAISPCDCWVLNLTIGVGPVLSVGT